MGRLNQKITAFNKMYAEEKAKLQQMISATTSFEDRAPLLEAFFRKMESLGDAIEDSEELKAFKT